MHQNNKIILSSIFFFFLLLFSLTFISAEEFGYNYLEKEPNVTITYENLNNSIYWNGNAWSDTRWLNIDGSNANTNIDIGSNNISASSFLGDFIGDGSQLTDVPFTELDPFWSDNFTKYNSSWTSTYNSTYNTWAYNQTIPANTYSDDLNSSQTTWVDNLFIRFTELVSQVGNWTLDKIDYWNTSTDLIITTNITTSGNLTADWFFANGYYSGQPLDGSIGSGIIYASQHRTDGTINVTDEGGLNAKYPSVVVKIWNIDTENTYCNFDENTIVVEDDEHTVYYSDNTCTLQSDTWVNFFAMNLNPSNYKRIFDVYAKNGDIEGIHGASIEGMNTRATKWLNVNCGASSHLSICDGIDTVEDIFPYFNQTEGSFRFLNTQHSTPLRNTETDGIHIVAESDGSHTVGTGLDLTKCDNGATLDTCSSNQNRRYIVYSIGDNSATEIHLLAPVDSETYTTFANCMNTEKYPLTWTLPSDEQGVAVVHSFYCGKRDATDWVEGAWGGITGNGITGTATISTSDFLRYSGWGANSDANNYNLTNINYLQAETLNITGTSYLGDVVIEAENITADNFFGNTSTWSRAGTNNFLTNSGDKVGIGTSSPERPLHVVLGEAGDLPSLGNQVGIFQSNSLTTSNAIFSIISGHTGTNVQGLAGFQFGDKDNVNRGIIYYHNPTDSLILGASGSITKGIIIDSSNNVGIGTATPSYPLEVNGQVSDISIYASHNISATGFITRTSIFDKNKNVWDYIKDADYYLTNGKIDHKKFYGYAGEFNVTDYSRTENQSYEEEFCETFFDNKLNQSVEECENITKYRTIYPYTKTEEGVNLESEINVLRQGIHNLKQENNLMKEDLCSLGITRWCE